MGADAEWWEHRRAGERTFAYLGRVLDSLGAEQLEANAKAKHYDDFECPAELDDGMNIQRLIAHLHWWATGRPRRDKDRAAIVIAAAKAGEFDSTKEESDLYAASPRGQADIHRLVDDG